MSNVQTKIWISLFMLVVFLVGLGVGVVATPWLGGRPRIGGMFGSGRPGPPGGPPAMNERLMERLSRSIELTDEQTDRLEALFDTSRDRFREISRAMRKRFDRERDTFRTALSDILTTEQLEQFESKIVRRGEEQRRRRQRPERGHPPGP